MEQAYGALLGACCGDAAGAVLEMLTRRPTQAEVQAALRMCGGGHHKVAPGQITDDGELTICLARGLVGCNGVFNNNKIAEEYAAWYKTDPFGVGYTAFSSIGAVVRGEANPSYKKEILEKKGYAYAMNWGSSSGEGKFSKANGSLMRATPLGVFAHKLPVAKIAEIARADSSKTHPNPSCGDSVACYSIAIAHLINNHGDYKGAFTAAKTWLASDSSISEVNNWLADAEGNAEIEFYPNAGFVKIAFTLAFRFLFNNFNYTDAIIITLAGGGDTDTNACIVGGLLGALHGVNSIPSEITSPVLSCDTSRGTRPRPEYLHPKHLEN